MPIRVLIVDDSSFFRRQITRILESDSHIEVVGAAVDGKDAILKAQELKPDVITMDVEMPVMNGILATREIMRVAPTPILMFSSITTDGAKATLDALDAGALDFLPKRFEDIARDSTQVEKVLCERVRAIAHKRIARRTQSRSTASTQTDVSRTRPAVPPRKSQIDHNAKGKISIVAIGTSTGGPVALQDVLTKIPANFPAPIVLVQHMPGTFTPAFAQRLNQLCAIEVKEAVDGDVLKPGAAYLAPGGRQMTMTRRGERTTLHVEDGAAGQVYKPSVDITFRSVAECFHGSVLAVVLTGMGADGCAGAKLLKQNGALVWAQDEATSTVYGMPAAVADAGITDRILPLSEIGTSITQQV